MTRTVIQITVAVTGLVLLSSLYFSAVYALHITRWIAAPLYWVAAGVFGAYFHRICAHIISRWPS